MATDRLQLLGVPTLVRGAASWVLPFERRSQLLVLLAMARSWVGRRDAAALLWPDATGQAAATNLRKTLFRLGALPWGDCVLSEGGALRFDGETDVAAFDAALRQGRVADALAMWQGEPLGGFDDDANDRWSDRLRHERERLRAAWRAAALGWLGQDVAPASAVALSARLLEADPWDDAALQLHLRWLERSGQGAAASQVHARFVERVRADLGVAPSADLLALAPAGAAAPMRASPAAGGAAAEDAGFIGRSAELRQIAALLEPDDGRLLTLLGPGGVGKTRLARRAAQELGARYADGALVVALDDLGAPEEIDARLARELGLAADGGGNPLDRVLQHLAGRRMLVVLDNFEHLVAGAARFERGLLRCAGLKLIVTSRVRLGLAGEQVLPIEGLPCPEPEDADCLDAFDAARLFVRSARRVAPAFQPGAEASAIVAVCALVGGLPLALELAAAWTRVLSCDAIAAELRRGTELLRTTDATHPGRHASIEAVFDQSWRLLTEAERDALARLSVFRGGFTSDAARAVTGTAPPVLGALADHSLLRREGDRMHLHPLVQQLAAARLAGAASAAVAAQAHAQHFHRLLAQLRAVAQDGSRDILRQLDAEFENCRAAWRWAVGADDADSLARSATTLTDFCDHRGRVAEGLALIEEALGSAQPAGQPRAHAVLQAQAAHLLYRLDRYEHAQSAAAQALSTAATLGDDETRLQALNTLGSCAIQLGRLDEAAGHFREHLRRAPAATDPHRAARSLNNLAIVEKAAGRYDRALALYSEALVLQQRFGDVSAEVKCQHNLALLHLSRGEADAAGARLRDALALCERHGFASIRATVLGALVDHARLGGDFEAAHRHATAAMAVALELGQRGLVCGLKLDFVHIALHRGDHDAARRALGEATALALGLGRPSLQLSALSWFAELLAATGTPDAARRVLSLALNHPATSPPERATLRTRIAAWANAAAGDRDATPGDGGADTTAAVDDLLRRVAAEAGIGHAPLIAELRADRRA